MITKVKRLAEPIGRSRRDGYSDATAQALLRAGRRHFGRAGYESSSLEDIARDARVTTGAIYHHFAGKRALFLAVAEQIEAELLARALAVDEGDPWSSVRKAFVDLLDACATGEVQRIVFVDAPRIVGIEAWREIEMRYALGGMSGALAQLAAAGVVRPCSIELVTPVLLSVLASASAAVAAAPALRGEAIDVMTRVLDTLRADPS